MAEEAFRQCRRVDSDALPVTHLNRRMRRCASNSRGRRLHSMNDGMMLGLKCFAYHLVHMLVGDLDQ
jgi:hypothetical protein